VRRHIVLLEFVSESCWAIEERSLDEVNKTWVEVDLNVSDRVPGHPDGLNAKCESTSLRE